MGGAESNETRPPSSKLAKANKLAWIQSLTAGLFASNSLNFSLYVSHERLSNTVLSVAARLNFS